MQNCASNCEYHDARDILGDDDICSKSLVNNDKWLSRCDRVDIKEMNC